MPTKKDVTQLNKADETARKVQLLYLKSVRDILKKLELSEVDYTQIFNLQDFPILNDLINKAIGELAKAMTKVINNATKSQWNKAFETNQGIASQYLKRGLLTEAQQKAHQSRNDAAYDAFQQRKLSGLKLSDRVWQYTKQFKGELEMGIDDALKEGTSAATLSRKIRANLQNPNDLFRRVRDKHGVLQLSKAMEKYHPSGGVYRSSYKNAMRLARTEVNMAYRASDHEQYKQFDFVLGYEIKRSNNVYGCGVCEELKGIYPKEFKFVGWHPQCRCYTVPILNPIEDFIEQQKAILEGKEYRPTKPVTALPKKFTDWFRENREKVRNLKKAPYFVRDNKRFILQRIALDDVMQKARESGGDVDWLANAIAKRFGGYTTKINYKSEASILRKVNGDYEGQFSKLQDAVRTTIIVPEDKQEQLLAYMEETGYFSRIKRQNAEDYMGYSGTIANMRTKNGLFAEIQVNTDRMIYAKEEPKIAKSILGLERWTEIRNETGLEGGLGHKIYEEYRLLDPRSKRAEELTFESFKYYENFRGEWQTAGIGVAPSLSSGLIESIDGLEDALKNKNYGPELVKTINEAAESLGIEIISNDSSVGGWYSSDKNQTIKEASKRIEIKYKTKEQLDAFASLLGSLAPEVQEGVYVAQYSEKGKDSEHIFKFDTNKNAEIVINKLNDFGLGDGFSYNAVTKSLFIGDLGNTKLEEIEKLFTFASKHGLKEHTYEKANISFPSKETYGETLQSFRDSFVREGKQKWNSFNSLYQQAAQKLNYTIRENDVTKLQELIAAFEAEQAKKQINRGSDALSVKSAKTIKEAEDWAKRNLKNIGSVDYSSIKVEQANKINAQLEELQEKNIIKSDQKFKIVGFISGDNIGGSYTMMKHSHGDAVLKIDGDFGNTYKKLMTEEAKKMNDSKKRIEENLKTWEAELKLLKEIDVDLLNGFEISELKTIQDKITGANQILGNTAYWTLEKLDKNVRRRLVSQAASLEEAIVHEFGHVLQADLQTNSEFYSEKIRNHILKLKKEKGFYPDNVNLTYSGRKTLFSSYTDSIEAFKISEYATENGFETFAESWTQFYRTGKTDIEELNELFTMITDDSKKKDEWYWNGTYLPDMVQLAKKEKVDSFDYYFQNGRWSTERQQLHDEIISDILNKYEPSRTGISYFLGGATANGKSTLVDSGALPHPKNAIVVNSDEIKAMLPEYLTMLGMNDKQAAAFVHEESSYLSKKLIATIQEQNMDFVLDGINDGNIDKLMKKVNQYKKNGTRIRADYVSLDTDLSVFLAEKRAKKEGRYVPLNVVVDANREVSNLVPKIIDAKAFDELYLWDTNLQGQKRLILTQIDGKLTIEDEDLYERFLSKGGEKSNILSKIWDDMRAKEQEIKERNTELAVFYDKLGNFISEKSGTQTHVEIENLPADAYMLTHNHDNNSSLSRGDLSFLLSRSQLNVIRAIGPNGVTYEMRKLYDNNAFTWKQTDLNKEWELAKEFADNEIETWLKKKYGADWSSIYWKENEERQREAMEVLGRHSDRMNWWMANKSKFKNLFVYKKYRT